MAGPVKEENMRESLLLSLYFSGRTCLFQTHTKNNFSWALFVFSSFRRLKQQFCVFSKTFLRPKNPRGMSFIYNNRTSLKLPIFSQHNNVQSGMSLDESHVDVMKVVHVRFVSTEAISSVLLAHFKAKEPFVL